MIPHPVKGLNSSNAYSVVFHFFVRGAFRFLKVVSNKLLNLPYASGEFSKQGSNNRLLWLTLSISSSGDDVLP